MSDMKVPELLAPAGDFEKLKTAIHYGADAVYLGDSRFSLRGKAGNFTDGELEKAVLYARKKGVKVYVTVNIFPHNRDLAGLEEHIELLREVRPDAVILSDPGLFMMFKKKAPEIEIHISTQANITNVESALFWEAMGAGRLVLSRELSVDEIRDIRRKTSVGLEVFVHGSMCISYSGRCYISSFLASRSANMGQCTNSCRWNYVLMEEKRDGEFFPVFENDRGTFIMSSKDLCMIEHLPMLAEAGIDSLKIEGRMKGINYIAGVVKTYREAIDSMGDGSEYRLNPGWLRELSMFSSRGYTTGMFFGKQPDEDYNFDGESYRMSHELVGIILGRDGNTASVGLRNRLDSGDPVEYLSPGLEEKIFEIGLMKDKDGTEIDSARNGDVVFIRIPDGVRRNDLIRRERGAGVTQRNAMRVQGDNR
ncbi:putative protease YhbU precursor [bacterium BMS3Bbin07]|nr:putative protease YhbU precursor [bacterium BMS3Bbin07]